MSANCSPRVTRHRTAKRHSESVEILLRRLPQDRIVLASSCPGIRDTSVISRDATQSPLSSADGRSVATCADGVADGVLADLPQRWPDVQNRIFVDFEAVVAHEIANGFADRHPELAAKHGFPLWQKAAGVAVAALIIVAMVLLPSLLLGVLVGVTTLIMLMQFVLIFAGLPRRRYVGAMFVSGFLRWIAGWRAVHQLITAPFLWEKPPTAASGRRYAGTHLITEPAPKPPWRVTHTGSG